MESRVDFKEGLRQILHCEKVEFDDGNWSRFDPMITDVSDLSENDDIIVTLEDGTKYLVSAKKIEL